MTPGFIGELTKSFSEQMFRINPDLSEVNGRFVIAINGTRISLLLLESCVDSCVYLGAVQPNYFGFL